MRLPIYIIPKDKIDEYQLMNIVKNGFVMCEIRRGMHGLPQEKMIAKKYSQRHLQIIDTAPVI